MKNNFRDFLEIGKQEEAGGKDFKRSPFNSSISYRLGRLSYRYNNCPKKQILIEELTCFFEEQQNSFLPNYVVLSLRLKYSHKLLKKVMLQLGYRIPVKPNCNRLIAWRVD